MSDFAAPMPSPAHPAIPAAAPVSDEQLVARLRAGEAAAGEELVRRYQQPLLRYLQRLVGSDLQAEELFQACWLSLLEHLDKFSSSSGAGGFKAWMYRIATNKTHDLWRSRSRASVARENLKLVIETEAPEASHRIEGAEQQQKLLWAIQQLPENQRQVLVLRYYSDLKFAEIADMLGCPLNTALGRMHKAMLKLQELMAEK